MKVAHTTCKPHEVKKCLKTLTNVTCFSRRAHTHTSSSSGHYSNKYREDVADPSDTGGWTWHNVIATLII